MLNHAELDNRISGQDTRIKLIENRMTYLESEHEGEKAVSRHVLQQTSRNADDLAELKTGVRRLHDQMLAANSTLHSQGSRLTLLTQDVGSLRHEVMALRRDQGEILARLASHDTRFDTLEGRFDGLEGRFDSLEGRFNGLEARLDAIAGDVAAIRAAVAPGTSRPA